MKSLLDTSVLIAASDAKHPGHRPSASLLAAATKQTTACGAHTLAEAYAVLSRLPGGRRLRPELAGKLVEQILDRVAVIPLTVEEYGATIRNAAQLSLAGGIVFDALLLACARKVDAERIYTWNVRHFRAVAPDLADRIVTP
jgi:predicted nucleic acid-binding protein